MVVNGARVPEKNEFEILENTGKISVITSKNVYNVIRIVQKCSGRCAGM
jgi:hypothetical protein